MKVNKHGDIIKKRTHKFKCYNCGCKYTADNGEWYYSESLISAKTNKPTDYVSSKCPECDKTNTVQWRGKLRDWWKAYHVVVFTIITLFALISLFASGILNSVRGAAISGIIVVICGSIAYFSSEM